MRIAGLHMRAYGHFSDYSLDFGAKPSLHLVYGNNEAGKSTTLRALSSVLFGYPHEVVDGFKHDARDIAIGIDVIAADGRRLSFVRRRRGKNALATAAGSGLDEAAVAGFLGGVSRDVFEKVFALDHHRLRAHAKALLADGGSLGFSLAEAGSGIAGLKAVLDKLREKRAALFLAGGSKPKLNQAIAQVTEYRKEARRCTVSPADYRSREKRIEEADAQLQEKRARRRDIESEIARLRRIAKNLPLRAEYCALTQQIAALEDVPLLPAEFTQRRAKAQADRDNAGEDINEATAAIEQLQSRHAAVTLDEDILARRQDIVKLANRRSIIEKHEADGPKRQAERVQLIAAVGERMAQVELRGDPADLANLLPSTLKRKAIQKLADDGRKLLAQCETELKNAENAARALNKARDGAAQAAKPNPIGDISHALAAADRLGDILADIAKRTRALDRKTKALNETVTGLGIATGVTGLREIAVPPRSAIVRYRDLLDAVDREHKSARGTVGRIGEELASIEQKVAALSTGADILTEDDVALARSIRDQGWLLVRGLYVERRSGLEEQAQRYAPDGRIADAYERSVSAADRSVDNMCAHVEEATELSLLRRRQAELEAKRTGAAAAAEAYASGRQAILSEWRGLWPAGFVSVQLPGEMLEWATKREGAIAAGDDLAAEQDAVKEAADKALGAKRMLAAALEACTAGPHGDGLDALREQARILIAEFTDANTRHEKAAEAVRRETARKAEADEAAEKATFRIADWNQRWRVALAEAGLSGDLTIEAAAVTLEVMNELDVVKSKIDDLTHRIEAMRQDRDAFREAVAAVAAVLPGEPAADAVDTCVRLQERLDAALQAAVERKSLNDQREMHKQASARAKAKLQRSRTVLAELCEQAGVMEADALAAVESLSAAKQAALATRETIARRVREDGNGRDVAALFAECDDASGDLIAADLRSLDDEREEAEAGFEKLMSERAAAQAEFDTLLAQNQAADFTQQAAILEAEIADMAEAYVDLTIQETLLREAIDQYRDRNQGPILNRAKALFAELTDGAYSGLRADINDKGETILIAEDRMHRSLAIDALSDGTVDPLYLALRLAVVQEHNATREPLPFVADDLLLNLDDARAQAALRTLAKVAAAGQVLMFTHHSHMVDLARAAVPSALLVEHHLSQAVVQLQAAE